MSLFDSGVRPAIDAYLAKEAAKVRDYGDYFSASSAGYCQRKVIFERLGVPPVTEDARKQRVFSSGHIFHEWIQRITKEAGLSIAQELELKDNDLMVKGHFDDLVLVAPYEVPEVYKQGGQADPPKHLILYDYKTAHSKSFTYKKDKMSHYWKLQLGTYMYTLRKHSLKHDPKLKGPWVETKDLTEARILIISKDDLRLAELQLMWSDELEKEVLDYWKSINTYWKNKIMPPCTCADHEGGFMAKEAWNGYYYNGQPCSMDWYSLQKEEGLLK